MDEEKILKTLTNAGFMITPEAISLLEEQPAPEKVLDILLSDEESLPFVISVTEIRSALEKFMNSPEFEELSRKAGENSGEFAEETIFEEDDAEEYNVEEYASESYEDFMKKMNSARSHFSGIQIAEEIQSDEKIPDEVQFSDEPDDESEISKDTEKSDSSEEFPKNPADGKFCPKFPFEKNPVRVIKDVADNSDSAAAYKQYISYFKDRFRQISEILEKQTHFSPISSVADPEKRKSVYRKKSSESRRSGSKHGNKKRAGSADANGDGGFDPQEISVAGYVTDKKETTNQHLVITLEDPTGSISVLADKNNKEVFGMAERLIFDEIIGVTGRISGDGTLINASKIIQPDIPNFNPTHRTEGYAVFISDIHVGSKEFLKDEWEMFLEFLRGETENDVMKAVAEKVRYLVVAGDIVDGIGIYPGQDKDLNIPDIFDQYREIARYFKMIPKNIHVVICPGNHDAVRRAEPQTTFSKEIRDMFPENVTFVGNPATVSLDGVRVLMYHGCSMDDMVANVKGVSYEKPVDGIREMLIRRHLAPTFGSRVIIAPEKHDYLVIDQIPDIFQCGHVHTVGTGYYKGIILINSGTWQSQTDFQRRVNIHPNPAIATVVNLNTWEVHQFDFNYDDDEEGNNERKEKEEKEKLEKDAIAKKHSRKKKNRRAKNHGNGMRLSRQAGCR